MNGILYPFTGTEVLDGKTWLKAEVELTYTDLNIIPRKAENWDWQDETRTYSNKTEAETTTLYMVFDDGTKIYTEKPEVKTREKRYLVVEYERNDGSAEDWYFYTWNNGYTGFYPFEKVDGVWKAEVPVKQNLSSISYCIEKGGDKWLEKDGNDYLCTMPVDQNVVKIKMSEGQGITYTYPYNIGYEMEPQEGTIHFYYRNDDAFRKGSKGGFQSVEIEINGTLYPMNWDAANQRYQYDYENLEPGTYKYRYVLKETGESTAEYALDKYNENKVTENNVEYSVCEYQLFDVTVHASVLNPDMDYNDNNVLSITFTGNNGADITKMKASAASADLSELGGNADTAVDPELLALSIAVKEGTTAGTKTIPVTVYDQYGNGYTTETTVNVVNRNKANDFDWDEAVIYFAVTDRFFDGNAANNGLGYDTNAATGPSSYHGGDFAGLTQKLDYLKDLGVNTIWITPIVEQQPTANVDTNTGISAWGYHGYWAKNFENLDSHLGTEEEFKALLDAAHAKGMKIMVDVVLNHSGYNAADSTELTDYFDQKVEGGMFRTADETINGSDQQSSLSGLPDFRTEDPEVRALLVEWQSKWVSKYDIDYYRVDTVKHVDDTTWSAFKNALTAINPDFKMIGEWAGAGYATDTGMLRTGRMDSLLDFDFNDRAVAFVNGDMRGTESFLTARNTSIDNTATLGAFLSSHDEDGLVQKLIDGGKTEAKALELAKVAASLQLTSKGQVVIYYGEEVGQYGKDNYPYQTNRYDFDWARTEAGANNTTLAHYKKLLAVRNQYLDVFAKGSRTTIVAEDTKGIDVFARSYNGTTLTVALNVSETEQKFVLSGWQAGTVLKDLYSSKEYEVSSQGTAEITIPAAADGGTAILIGVKRNGDTEEFATPDLQAGFDVRCIEETTYTGKNITLSETQLRVYNGLTELKCGTDYTVKYKNNKAVGTATVTITGKGNYTGKATTTFNIVPKNIADTNIEYQDAMIATNKNLKPLTKITYNGIKLGTKDYKAEYYLLDESGNRTGEARTAAKEAGDYELVITGLHDAETNKGNFTGSTTKKIKIYAKDSVTYIKNTTITFPDNKKSYSEVYTGKAIEPVMTVTPKGSNKTPLTLGTEYTVSYDNQVEVGTASVTITGVPEKGYIGSVTKTYKITGVKLSTVAMVDETNWQPKVVYDIVSGQAVQPAEVGLKAKNGTDKFTEGTDYTVSYQKNNKPGSATMVFTGKGKYTGTVTKKFTVSKIDLKADDSRLQYTVAAEAPYAKKGAKAAVTVKYDGVLLREGIDYKLTFGNNKTLTTDTTAANKMPNVKITGAGAFAGTLQNMDASDPKHTTFRIVQSDLSTLKLTAADKVFKNKNGAFISAPVLTENTGAKLTNNKDYEVKYYLVGADGSETEKLKTDTVEIGEQGYTTIKMVATAKENGNYKGTISTTYRVVTANISGAKVTINAKVYTGKAITLDEQDFTKIKIGNQDLVYGTDYEIVKDSYVNNVKKGTASVTIKGLGNYGGTKKVTFKITNRTIAWWWNLLH